MSSSAGLSFFSWGWGDGGVLTAIGLPRPMGTLWARAQGIAWRMAPFLSVAVWALDKPIEATKAEEVKEAPLPGYAECMHIAGGK